MRKNLVRTLGIIAVSSVALAVACSSDDRSRGGNGDDPDAGPADDAGVAGKAEIEVGTGASEFTTLGEGDVLDIIQGPQAGGSHCEGHHIWMAVRIAGVDLETLDRVRVTISSTTGEERARVERVPADAAFKSDGRGGMVLVRLSPRLDDCCLVDRGEVVLEAMIWPVNGSTLADSRRVRTTKCPAEGADVCVPAPALCE